MDAESETSSSCSLLGNEKSHDVAAQSLKSQAIIGRNYAVNRLNILMLTLLGLVTIPSLFIILFKTMSLHGQTYNSNALAIHCGNTTAEARQRGCHFDILSFGWYPEACWDAELYNEFIERYNSSWAFQTIEGIPVPLDEVQRGEHEYLATTWELHLVHCLFAWQKAIKAVLLNRPLDEWSPRYLHSKHCEYELMHADMYGAKEMVTKIKMWYPLCGLSTRNMAQLLTYVKPGNEMSMYGHHHHG